MPIEDDDAALLAQSKYTAKQLVDIEIATEIVEYREHKGVCTCCRQQAKNSAPVRDIITYGNKLKSFVALLSFEGIVSTGRIKEKSGRFTQWCTN